jgi:hypothetical protein
VSNTQTGTGEKEISFNEKKQQKKKKKERGKKKNCQFRFSNWFSTPLLNDINDKKFR